MPETVSCAERKSRVRTIEELKKEWSGKPRLFERGRINIWRADEVFATESGLVTGFKEGVAEGRYTDELGSGDLVLVDTGEIEAKLVNDKAIQDLTSTRRPRARVVLTKSAKPQQLIRRIKKAYPKNPVVSSRRGRCFACENDSSTGEETTDGAISASQEAFSRGTSAPAFPELHKTVRVEKRRRTNDAGGPGGSLSVEQREHDRAVGGDVVVGTEHGMGGAQAGVRGVEKKRSKSCPPDPPGGHQVSGEKDIDIHMIGGSGGSSSSAAGFNAGRAAEQQGNQQNHQPVSFEQRPRQTLFEQHVDVDSRAHDLHQTLLHTTTTSVAPPPGLDTGIFAAPPGLRAPLDPPGGHQMSGEEDVHMIGGGGGSSSSAAGFSVGRATEQQGNQQNHLPGVSAEQRAQPLFQHQQDVGFDSRATDLHHRQALLHTTRTTTSVPPGLGVPAGGSPLHQSKPPPGLLGGPAGGPPLPPPGLDAPPGLGAPPDGLHAPSSSELDRAATSGLGDWTPAAPAGARPHPSLHAARPSHAHQQAQDGLLVAMYAKTVFAASDALPSADLCRQLHRRGFAADGATANAVARLMARARKLRQHPTPYAKAHARVGDAYAKIPCSRWSHEELELFAKKHEEHAARVERGEADWSAHIYPYVGRESRA